MTSEHLTNHQLRLASRPVGLPTADNWQSITEPVAGPAAGPATGSVVDCQLAAVGRPTGRLAKRIWWLVRCSEVMGCFLKRGGC